MSDTAQPDDAMRDDDMLAAEYALGLLEGEELLAARGRVANDPHFAASVAWWEAKLAPLADEIGALEPGPHLWSQIEAALNGDTGGSAEIVSLRKRLRNWQIAGSLSAAAAVATLSFLFLTPSQIDTPVPSVEAPLVASIPIGDTQLRLAVTYLPDRSELLVSASGLTADGVHDHELWLVPSEGPLQSLGVVAPGEERRVQIQPAVAQLIENGSPLVLTREPLGGKPPQQDAGPVVAEGQLQQI